MHKTVVENVNNFVKGKKLILFQKQKLQLEANELRGKVILLNVWRGILNPLNIQKVSSRNLYTISVLFNEVDF